MKFIIQQYGIDWVAMLFTIFAVYLLGNKNRKGFVFMMVANFFWVALGLLLQNLPIIIANSCFFIMNLRGFLKWQVRIK